MILMFQWNHMKVKCPVLSVVRLAKDGNEAHIHKRGGEFVDVTTGKRLRLFEHSGVYYKKLSKSSKRLIFKKIDPQEDLES